jgi:tRNA pseudouridine38-40 synthase
METDGPSISLTFTGDGFLYKMVRILTAACIRLAQRKAPLATLQSLLENGTPRFTHTAPAYGLCLVRVDYPAA